jgi:hypothetical protein
MTNKAINKGRSLRILFAFKPERPLKGETWKRPPWSAPHSWASPCSYYLALINDPLLLPAVQALEGISATVLGVLTALIIADLTWRGALFGQHSALGPRHPTCVPCRAKITASNQGATHERHYRALRRSKCLFVGLSGNSKSHEAPSPATLILVLPGK